MHDRLSKGFTNVCVFLALAIRVLFTVTIFTAITTTVVVAAFIVVIVFIVTVHQCSFPLRGWLAGRRTVSIVAVAGGSVVATGCIVAQGSEASYTNRLLALLSTEYSATADENDENEADWELSEHLTSQSTRSGSATFANEHSEMQTQWIIPRGGWRGGWTLEGVQTIFNYVSGTSLTDARVGRALSGWESVSKGILIACMHVLCQYVGRPSMLVSILGSHAI